MVQDGIPDNNPPRKVLRVHSPQPMPTRAQADLVEKIRSLEGRYFKERRFDHFTSNRYVASSELNVTIEVQPYFESLKDFINFLKSFGIQHIGANYEQDTTHGRVYKHLLNGVSMRFYRVYGAPPDAT
ncbi:hypothetical protein HYX06_06680 [Candidatus Woesearchaeota archaeon]|nr:hypothetical protein [Candidatus Woesearchaeota archaeon]